MKRYVTTLLVNNFNSIKVRLELLAPQRAFHSNFYFNSIKVRLELKKQV